MYTSFLALDSKGDSGDLSVRCERSHSPSHGYESAGLDFLPPRRLALAGDLESSVPPIALGHLAKQNHGNPEFPCR
jgi:hypothetical protein